MKIKKYGQFRDIVLIAVDAAGMKQCIKWFKKYPRKKGFVLNTKKSKIMICRKGGGRRKCIRFKWDKEEI